MTTLASDKAADAAKPTDPCVTCGRPRREHRSTTRVPADIRAKLDQKKPSSHDFVAPAPRHLLKG